VFSTDEMVEFFDLDKVGRSAARFDFAKLESLNGHYMRASSDAELLAAIDALVPYLPDAEHRLPRMTDTRRAQLAAAMPGLKERAKTLVELLDNAEFIFVERPIPLDEKATTLLSPEARAHLGRLVPLLEAVDWSAAATEEVVRRYAEAQSVKLGAVAQPLRAALTGKSTSPPVFDVLAVLGREESLGRLRDQAI
jgi:glutamyl-tRNA synthetase